MAFIPVSMYVRVHLFPANFMSIISTCMQLQVFNATAANTTTSGRGSINFGIFSGSHVIAYRESPILNTIEDSYFVCKY